MSSDSEPSSGSECVINVDHGKERSENINNLNSDSESLHLKQGKETDNIFSVAEKQLLVNACPQLLAEVNLVHILSQHRV